MKKVEVVNETVGEEIQESFLPDEPEQSNVEVLPPDQSLAVTTTVPGFMTCAEIISKLRVKYHGRTYDATTPAGMREAIDARAELRAARISLDKEKPKVKEDARKFLDSVEKEYKAIRGAIIEYEDIPDAAIQAETTRKENEKAAAAKAEEDRRALILDNVNRIAAIPSTAVGLSSIELQDLILKTVSLPITGPDFQEFLSKAESVRDDALRQLREMLLKVAEQEMVSARLQAQMEEMTRQQAEKDATLAEEKRLADIEAEKVAEENRIAGEKLAAEQKALADKQAAIEREQAEFLAEQKRINDEAAAKLREEREAFEKQQAEAARIAQEKADKEAAELADAQRLEEERKAAERREEEAKAAAEKAEADRLEQEKRDAEAAALRAELEKKLQEPLFALQHIHQLAIEAQENPFPFDLIKQIVDIAGKFIQETGHGNELAEYSGHGKTPSQRGRKGNSR